MIRRHTVSFKYAIEGIRWALTTQPNYRIHIFLSLLSLLGGWFFKISYVEFMLIILMIFLGLTIEALNTSIEAACDAIDKNIRQDIKITKDVAAAAMLFYATGAFIVACMIFIPRIIALIQP